MRYFLLYMLMQQFKRQIKTIVFKNKTINSNSGTCLKKIKAYIRNYIL